MEQSNMESKLKQLQNKSKELESLLADVNDLKGLKFKQYEDSSIPHIRANTTNFRHPVFKAFKENLVDDINGAIHIAINPYIRKLEREIQRLDDSVTLKDSPK